MHNNTGKASFSAPDGVATLVVSLPEIATVLLLCCVLGCILQVGVMEAAFLQGVIAAAPQWLPGAGALPVMQVSWAASLRLYYS